MNQITEEGSLAGLAQQIEQGLDPYAVIGKLYVRTLAKDQALALAIQALQALAPKDSEQPKEPEQPTVIYGSPADLPLDAPEGTIASVAMESAPVVAMESGVATPGNDFGAMPRAKKTRRVKRG